MFGKRKETLYPWEAAALLGLSVVLLSGVWAREQNAALADKVIRLHVIASSDNEEDQRIKLLVRDAVLSELSPVLEKAADAAAAEREVRALLPRVEALAEEVSGCPARAELGRESYPTRVYDTFSLPAGVYTSLRVTLGEGQGRNWWCVVYPPLCGAAAEELRQTASLSPEETSIITEDGTQYILKFRLLEWWGELVNRLS